MVPFSIGYDRISCAYGTIGPMKNGFFGVNKYKQKQRDACIVDDKYDNKICSASASNE